jgi:hypothetical protein
MEIYKFVKMPLIKKVLKALTLPVLLFVTLWIYGVIDFQSWIGISFIVLIGLMVVFTIINAFKNQKKASIDL